ncbi:pseudouridine synthase [Amphibacillus sediminis]|uniref:pseudouridine synthase n=1 Tax=Amphibacillus sediminis TaxID=360185 RepID=UPI000836C9B8|nr:pseudouridine synthase [Amphibacillus sediminis]
MRLDKLLANCGYGSRKEVKLLIKKGAIKVNGELIKQVNIHIDPKQDCVQVQEATVRYEEFVYLVMHKPQGVISATRDSRERTILDLLEDEDRLRNPFPVGRLDKDTEGLLLITNDGQLAHRLLSPKKLVGKTYYAEISGEVTDHDVEAFKQGVKLDDGYVTMPGQLTILKSGPVSEIELTIMEGKYHQVKRMFESVGKKVVYLKRVAIGDWQLDPELKKGEYRRLLEEEISYLRKL